MLTQQLADADSMRASVADPHRAPEMLAVREAIRGWRFYDQFRTDSDSPARITQIGTWTPILHHDGSNLAAALQTIMEIRSDEAFAFCGLSPQRSCPMEHCDTCYGLQPFSHRIHRR